MTEKEKLQAIILSIKDQLHRLEKQKAYLEADLEYFQKELENENSTKR